MAQYIKISAKNRKKIDHYVLCVYVIDKAKPHVWAKKIERKRKRNKGRTRVRVLCVLLAPRPCVCVCCL